MQQPSCREGRWQMSELRSKRTETEQVSRVDSLLDLLKDLSQRDPSPALRERLAVLASQRLRENRGGAARLRAIRQKAWFKPAFAVVLLAAVGLATLFVIHSRQH